MGIFFARGRGAREICRRLAVASCDVRGPARHVQALNSLTHLVSVRNYFDGSVTTGALHTEDLTS